MLFWAKEVDKIERKWGKIFEIFRDKTQLGGQALVKKQEWWSVGGGRVKFLLPRGNHPSPPMKKNPDLLRGLKMSWWNVNRENKALIWEYENVISSKNSSYTNM